MKIDPAFNNVLLSFCLDFPMFVINDISVSNTQSFDYVLDPMLSTLYNS